MQTKVKSQERLEDMSNEELLELQDGFMKLRQHADSNLERIIKIMHDRLENNAKL